MISYFCILQISLYRIVCASLREKRLRSCGQIWMIYRVEWHPPNWHMTNHGDGCGHWHFTNVRQCVPSVLSYGSSCVLAHRCSCHCFPPLLWHESPTLTQQKKLSPINADIHQSSRFISILVSTPYVRNLALFSLICIKQRWPTRQGSKVEKTV